MLLHMLRVIVSVVETIVTLPLRVVSFLFYNVFFNPRLGHARFALMPVFAYLAFAVTLVYVIAPIRGFTGQVYQSAKLNYDTERWLATAIYDNQNNFVGTYPLQLDSQQDVNYLGRPIELSNGYVANPDHKSIPVKTVPDYYWKCLVYHEDRNLGSLLNPFGIDLMGVLKIPYTTVSRTIRSRGLRFGVGGSTLSMQLARIVYKTPPRRGESVGEKLRRKFSEWWLAPVIYRELTKDGTNTRLKQWAADHLWLAQRTGGPPLHGVETTSRIVFGKEAKDLSTAEQFVLASAVNKPIILLEGSENLNRVRLDRWKYIIEVRAKKCAEEVLTDPAKHKKVIFELVQLAGGPPDPQLQPTLRKVLEQHAPRYAKPARANPALRANMLIPAAIYGVREQMKDEFGFAWRNHVRGVNLTLDVAQNRTFRARVQNTLAKLQKTYGGRINDTHMLSLNVDETNVSGARKMPDVVIAAANARGEIVRFFEATSNASYFGSPTARDFSTGRYDPEKETRAIASVGKIIAAVAIANTRRDGLTTRYLDTTAPAKGLESCRRKGNLRRGRTAQVVFACSLSVPLENRTARLSPQIRNIIDRFGFAMPPALNEEDETPASTAAVRGLITGSPRRVHHMSSVLLAGLTGRGANRIEPPTLVRNFDRQDEPKTDETQSTRAIVPNDILRTDARGIVRAFLSQPLCYEHRRRRHGTLKSLAKWCHQRRKDIRMHFAKTGTHVNEDPDATVDVWVTGGLQFGNGAAYSYVVMVGTGSTSEPWARKLHAAQIAAPLAETLLEDLETHAKANPMPIIQPKKSVPVAGGRGPGLPTATTRVRVTDTRSKFDQWIEQ